MNQRSHSAAPSENYRSSSIQRRGSLSPPEDLYQDYSGLTVHNRVQQRSQSRSATVTPTGSPKKRQLPQVPQNSMSAGSSTTRMVLRDRYVFIYSEINIILNYHFNACILTTAATRFNGQVDFS